MRRRERRASTAAELHCKASISPAKICGMKSFHRHARRTWRRARRGICRRRKSAGGGRRRAAVGAWRWRPAVGAWRWRSSRRGLCGKRGRLACCPRVGGRRPGRRSLRTHFGGGTAGCSLIAVWPCKGPPPRQLADRMRDARHPSLSTQFTRVVDSFARHTHPHSVRQGVKKQIYAPSQHALQSLTAWMRRPAPLPLPHRRVCCPRPPCPAPPALPPAAGSACS